MPETSMTSLALINRAISNFNQLDSAEKSGSRFGLSRAGRVRRLDIPRFGKLYRVNISTSDPADRLTGLNLKTDSPFFRNRNPRSVSGFYFDKGIFTNWRVKGSNGPDSVIFGPQGHIITKGLGGVFNMGRDRAQDIFTFTNTINVERISRIFGRPVSPLNHLAGVKITNFGREDIINLQGKIYRWEDVNKSTGALPGVEPSRISVSLSTLS